MKVAAACVKWEHKSFSVPHQAALLLLTAIEPSQGSGPEVVEWFGGLPHGCSPVALPRQAA